MVNYQNGKIYKIVSDNTDKIYIGSTCVKYLSNRLGGHVKNYKKNNTKKYKSFEIIKLGNYKIELIEYYKCNNKEELWKRERFYIELNKDIVVNRFIPTRTASEWYEDNKEQKKLKVKIYRNNNTDMIKQKNKIHKICVCSSILTTKNHIKRHELTKKHIDFMKKL